MTMKIFRHKNGMTLIETLVVVAISSVVLQGVSMLTNAGRNSWSESNIQATLQNDLRLVLQKISKELRDTGTDSVGISQMTVQDSVGVNGTDIIRFSIPVLCSTTATLTDVNGNVAHWGAALTWGCNQSSCMDQDNNCATVEYKYIEYKLNNSNQMLRRVLRPDLSEVRNDIIANNVTNFQVSVISDADASLDKKIVNISVSVQGVSNKKRTHTKNASLNVYLRNRR